MQVRQMREEVISDEHCKHNEVVDDALEVVVERQRAPDFSELEVQVLAQERQVEKIEIN